MEKVGGDAAKWGAKLAKASEETDSFLIDELTKWNDKDHGQDYGLCLLRLLRLIMYNIKIGHNEYFMLLV